MVEWTARKVDDNRKAMMGMRFENDKVGAYHDDWFVILLYLTVHILESDSPFPCNDQKI